MGNKLAIKGHLTRGKEVIELLEMMGGNTFNSFIENAHPNRVYYIGNNNAITWTNIYSDNGCLETKYFFTLEEFLEKYPFKVGDKVVDRYGDSLTIRSMSWSEDCETMVYDFEDSVIVLAAEDMKLVDDNTSPTKMKNVLAELLEHIKNTSKEDLEREFKEIESEGWTRVGPTVEEFRTFCECVNKKPKYPTTYEECCKILNTHCTMPSRPGYKEGLIANFQELLICRDAYWKIAGEGMGLDKPWELPLPSLFETVHCIRRKNNEIIKGSYRGGKSEILEFPTEEMRDAFCENFKDLIERCKEIL